MTNARIYADKTIYWEKIVSEMEIENQFFTDIKLVNFAIKQFLLPNKICVCPFLSL